MLRLLPEHGGKSVLGTDTYLHGPPELVVEIAHSSAAKDARVKKESYRKLGVQEYLLRRVLDDAVDWWSLENGQYVPLPADEAGVVKSRVCPGLWLDVPALLALNGARVMAVLSKGLRSVSKARPVA